MSLPCGMSDGLPVGLMLIGKYFDESDDLSGRRGVRGRRRLEADVTGQAACSRGGPP